MEEAARKPSMVEKTCTAICRSAHPERGGTRFSAPTKTDAKNSTKKRPRNKFGAADATGVPGKRCSQRGQRSPKHQAFGAVVRAVQARGATHETSSHCRLQGAKSVLQPGKDHSGDNPNHLPSPEKGMVLRKTGPTGCVFSSESAGLFSKIRPHAGWRKTVGVFGCPIWAQQPSKTFHVHHEATAKTVALQGSHGIRLFGRHHCVWFHKNFDRKTFRPHAPNVSRSWIQGEHQKNPCWSQFKWFST